MRVARFCSSHSGLAPPVRNCRYCGTNARPEGAWPSTCPGGAGKPGLRATAGREVLEVTVCTDSVIHVVATPEPSAPAAPRPWRRARCGARGVGAHVTGSANAEISYEGREVGETIK
jgi:hypothetical protein